MTSNDIRRALSTWPGLTRWGWGLGGRSGGGPTFHSLPAGCVLAPAPLHLGVSSISSCPFCSLLPATVSSSPPATFSLLPPPASSPAAQFPHQTAPRSNHPARKRKKPGRSVAVHWEVNSKMKKRTITLHVPLFCFFSFFFFLNCK